MEAPSTSSSHRRERIPGSGARGARRPALEWTVDELESPAWNGAAYANTLAVGGYVNLRSTATIHALSDALDPAADGSSDVMDFLAAPGRLATGAGCVGRHV